MQLSTRMERIEGQQDALMQTMINMENELKPRVTALFDAFELRDDQIGNLREEIRQEFSSIKLDINYMLNKVVQYNTKFDNLERARS